MEVERKLELLKKKPFVSSFQMNSKEILKEKDLKIFEENLSFTIDNNIFPILQQNFILNYFRFPVFNNLLVLENNTSQPSTEFLVSLSRLPFELVVAESKYDFFDFICEKNINGSLEYKYACGFYININKKFNETKILQLYDYITLFVLKNNDIEIIEKNDTLKYWSFYIASKCSRPYIFEGIFFSGTSLDYNEVFVKNLFKKLKITNPKISNEEYVKDLFINNKTINKNLRIDRSPYNLMFCMMNGKNNFLVNFKLYIYFLINLDKQKKLITDILKHSNGVLLSILVDIIDNFNNKTFKEFPWIVPYNDEIVLENIRFKKNNSKDFDCFKIDNLYNKYFRYICGCNNIDFGSDLLVTPKDFTFKKEKVIKDMNLFLEKALSVVEEDFKKINDII